jgi:membrane-anchored glycerophosphoryl diester phosphodiesterase (GDPDase)
MLYLSVSLIFALPLIIDKDLDFLPAMGLSWRMVGRHWFLIFGLVVLMEIVKLSGLLGCCIGILFTIPIGYGALMCAYETIFCQPNKD